jgi:hypothetical protein
MKYETLVRQLSKTQENLDFAKDENISLKLRISELESDILEERTHKQQKYELTVDSVKA